MDRENRCKYIVYGVFILIFSLRMINITNPPLDYSSWRQTDTDSIARNFVEYKFNIFYPQLNYDGPMPNYVQLELQVTTFIIAILYKIFGYYPVLGRMVPVVFFMGSCYYLYLCVKRKSGANIAILSVLFYGILPINVVYSRNIMPESALMFFTIGSLYYFLVWIDTERFKPYLVSLLFCALAVSTKVPAAIIGIPMVYLAASKHKRKAFKNPLVYIYPIAALALPYFYFRWLYTIAEQGFVSGIGQNMILPNFLSAIFKGDNLRYLGEQFASKIFTVPGFILFFIGLGVKKSKEERFYYLWLLGAVLHIIFIDAVIHLDYYMMLITPIISVFMAYAGFRILSSEKNRYFLYLAVIAMLMNTGMFMRMVYGLQESYLTIGEHVKSVSDKNDLIIIGKDSPELLYTTDRKGWRLYGDILTGNNIIRLAGEGAKYFVPPSKDLDQNIKNFLDNNYTRISFSDGYYIYRLSK